MSEATRLQDDLGVWARRGLAPSSLTEVDAWDAFERRDRVARSVAAGEALPDHLAEALAAADDLWHDARAMVEPLLRLGTYLATRPADHYVRTYLAEELT